jgi:predicted kinase
MGYGRRKSGAAATIAWRGQDVWERNLPLREVPPSGLTGVGVKPQRIVIVSGPPGAGKTAVARRLAEESDCERAIHLHTDDFYAYIRKGYVAPWRLESRAQNTVVLEALAATAGVYARGGYEVYADGIVGPWFLEPWLHVAERGALDLRYVLLLPDEATTITRATSRPPPALVDPEPIRFMWQQFAAIERYATHRVDTSRLDLEQAVAYVRNRLAAGDFSLGRVPT